MLLLGMGVLLVYMERQLPDVSTLKNVQLQVPLRVYTHDGKLIAEFGEMRRFPVPFDKIPKPLIQAVLATEDQRFYEHVGIDLYGLLRAGKHLLETGTKGQGGSTITMQVARNFFLTPQKTYSRKLREILLALKIDQELPKDKILELYLNKIFFGNRAYGIEAAARVYYGKSLTQLNLSQMAMLAGLPKAPSSLNPLANPQAALERRNHVLTRMRDLGYIDEVAYKTALRMPLDAQHHTLDIEFSAPYVAEMARNLALEKYGAEAYAQGLVLYTSVDSRMQQMAQRALRQGLLAYDRRHGYRGAEYHVPAADTMNVGAWVRQLQRFPIINGVLPAVVIGVKEQSIQVLLPDQRQIEIAWSGLAWAKRRLQNTQLSATPRYARDIVQVGDVVRVTQDNTTHWSLTQLPEVEGALVSLDPNSGAIRALVGGFAYERSNFNRAWQAKRQPGSSFKPFVYAAALAKGYTLASVVNDAPVVLHDTGDETLWRPQNDTRRFYGPTRLRVGLIKSRNLVSIRLLQDVTIPFARDYLRRFGFALADMPDSLSLALGTGSVTPLELARGYAVFANGGYLLEPYLLEKVVDVHDRVLYQAPVKQLQSEQASTAVANTADPAAVHPVAQSVASDTIYLMNSALQDVIVHGTGHAASVLGRYDIAGKTGTTNEQMDAWFAGYNPDLTTVVWVGFDQPRSLYEYGSTAALPIWVDFMRQALRDKPIRQFVQPDTIVTVRIDPVSGLLARAGQAGSVFESFSRATVPTEHAPAPGAQEGAESVDDMATEPLF